MNKPVIVSLNNEQVKRARSLRQKKSRVETGLFLVEGIHHIGGAVDSGWDVETIFYAPELLSSKFANELISRLPSKVQSVSSAVIASLAEKDNPQGIVAVVRQKQAQFSNTLIPKSAVAIVSPQDPGNVGAILRTMDAVGTGALFLLDGGVELYHPTVIRSSMGALFWKPVIQTSFAEFIAWARVERFHLIGASARGDVECRTLVPQSPWILVLGNEQKGLSPEQIKACDVTVSLPMKGRVTSLNLAVAAGVLLYQLNQSGQA
jgi:TrmH family RNA methyltransferase